ncbi:MAG: winged helix-turn-helix domain-containing protein [Saprospiraceae bacterium]|nr:winged helix-turn-helix domain-containing protein [Saprospiraceae bacterium]
MLLEENFKFCGTYAKNLEGFIQENKFLIKCGAQPNSNDRTVDVHIVQLRRKIDKSLIKSIKGVGYK